MSTRDHASDCATNNGRECNCGLRFRCLRPDHTNAYDQHVLASDYDALKAKLDELKAVNDRLRISWREDTAILAIERDQWKKAYLKTCAALEKDYARSAI